ncbi:MAG: hypothetical protein ACOYJB_09035 [Christensenellaceae bacterium]
MHSLIINLSPRAKGTSAMLSALCQYHLTGSGHTVEVLSLYAHPEDAGHICNAVGKADCVVMVGPCYLNTFPADTFWLLEQLHADTAIQHGQLLYGVIQGGMPYVHTHKSGLNALRLFADSCNFRYGGGFVLGLGAMLDGRPIEKLPNGRKVKRNLEAFLDHVCAGETSPDALYEKSQLKVPSFLARILAANMNKSIDKDLISHRIDPKQKSPYG